MRGILPLIALSVVLPACTGPERLATPRITPPYGSVDNQQEWRSFMSPIPRTGPVRRLPVRGRESTRNLGRKSLELCSDP